MGARMPVTGELYEATVPASIALPSDPDDQSPDYDVTVQFAWTPGLAPGARTMADPMGTDDGAPDEFDVVTSGGVCGEDLPDSICEAVAEWLDEHWERPGGWSDQYPGGLS